MGLVINVRGTSGSGKTTLVRRLMAEFGWPAGEAVTRPGRDRPLAWRLAHPLGGRPLVVLGHYGEGPVGGCDTIGQADGGPAGALALADSMAAEGHDVLLEGLVLSGEHVATSALARRRPLHVLRLDTPVADCVRHLCARRRCGPGSRPVLAAKVERERAALEQACGLLHGLARVESLGLQAALGRSRQLLGLEPEAKPLFQNRFIPKLQLPILVEAGVARPI